jgi:hypothetical protein
VLHGLKNMELTSMIMTVFLSVIARQYLINEERYKLTFVESHLANKRPIEARTLLINLWRITKIMSLNTDTITSQNITSQSVKYTNYCCAL